MRLSNCASAAARARAIATSRHTLSLTGIAMAESGGNSRNTKPKGLKAKKKTQQSVAAKGSVVFIATAERVFDPFTRNAIETPRGTGSGFVWDELGHVVTNNHVIAGASQAVVRLGRWSILSRVPRGN